MSDPVPLGRSQRPALPPTSPPAAGDIPANNLVDPLGGNYARSDSATVASLATDVPRTGDELKRVKKEMREKSVEPIEKAFVLEALKRNGWNVTHSAESAGMLRANFQALMKKHGISQLPVLDKRFKQDPATSTVTFAKTFGWAAQVLGVVSKSWRISMQ